MSIDEVMASILVYGIEQRRATINDSRSFRTSIKAAIEQHVAEAVARERQAIEKICEEFGAWNKTASEILDAIYDRSGKEPKP